MLLLSSYALPPLHSAALVGVDCSSTISVGKNKHPTNIDEITSLNLPFKDIESIRDAYMVFMC